jgi:hypothetical protein
MNSEAEKNCERIADCGLRNAECLKQADGVQSGVETPHSGTLAHYSQPSEEGWGYRIVGMTYQVGRRDELEFLGGEGG